MKRILFLSLILLISLSSRAQTEQELLAQLLEEEKNTVEALVLYPVETRVAILEAARFPEALIRLEVMQEKTSAAFKDLVDDYPKETQEMIWDLTRYPDLISKLVAAGHKSEEQMKSLLADFPVEVQDRAATSKERHFDLLLKVDDLNEQTGRAFADLIREYPIKTQAALRQLVELPEVLSLLSEDIRLTVLVGDLYRKNPEWLLQQLDSLNLVVAREHANELEDWKTSLDANPQAKEELVNSAQAFAIEYDYDDAYYDYDDMYDYPEEVVVEHHYYHHYPYWFGYPNWYLYPRWRPYPFWYDWGFYWGSGHVLIVIDLPSFYFTDWYFYHPHHHHYYPHLSSHFANHYYGHRTSSTSAVSSVRNWRNRNRDVVTDDWLERSRKNPDQFKEYGKFETERQKYNRSHPDKPAAPRDFLDKNERKYPTLSKERKQIRSGDEQIRKDPPTEPPLRKPRIEPPKTKEPAAPPRRPDVKEPHPKTGTEPKTNPTDIPKVDKARDYHRDRWEKSQPQKQREITKPRTQPAPPKPKPERKAPSGKKEVNKRRTG